MSQVWEGTGEQVSHCALGTVFVYMTSAVDKAQSGSASILNVGCPWHPLGGSRKEEAGSEEADTITCTWYGICEASWLSPVQVFFCDRSDILCPKMRSGLGTGSRNSPGLSALNGRL